MLDSTFPDTSRPVAFEPAAARDGRSRVQLIRDHLEDDILNGRLCPGQQLPIDELAGRFGVSRTPVREALQQLEASGLVKVWPKRGTFVAQISLAELIQMFEVMAELEATCARLAARRASPEAIQAIAQAMHDAESEGVCADPNAYYYANERFHRLIYDACGNTFLAQQTLALKNRLKPFRRLQLQLRNRIAASRQEHRTIVAALLAGDEEGAARAARDHVLIQGQRFTDLMSLTAAGRAAGG